MRTHITTTIMSYTTITHSSSSKASVARLQRTSHSRPAREANNSASIRTSFILDSYLPPLLKGMGPDRRRCRGMNRVCLLKHSYQAKHYWVLLPHLLHLNAKTRETRMRRVPGKADISNYHHHRRRHRLTPDPRLVVCTHTHLSSNSNNKVITSRSTQYLYIPRLQHTCSILPTLPNSNRSHPHRWGPLRISTRNNNNSSNSNISLD